LVRTRSHLTVIAKGDYLCSFKTKWH